ncbi:type 1 glutamine amidotransferase domain-containing protein [Nocardioides ultimimeridianus]
MAKILFVVTGASTWTLANGTAHPTGFWAEELLEPYRALTAAGHTVDIATPGGVVPTVDRASLTPEYTGGADVTAELDAIDALRHPIALTDVDLEAYAAVYYPGGHGPMEDLVDDRDSGALLVAALDSGRPLAVVCHGSVALLAADRTDGTWAFAGKRITGFTDEEERQGGLAANAPFLAESRLREAGAVVEVGAPWSDHVVVDGNLITGQNPQSSASVGKLLVDALA